MSALMATTVFSSATLIDGTGNDPRPNTSVVVEDATIARVVADAGLALPSGALVIDCAGRTLMPGLTDAHTHLGVARPWSAMANQPGAVLALHIARVVEATLDAGFTTVRDAGGIDGAWAHAVQSGLLRGPRILPSGAALSQTGGHGDGRPRFSDDSLHGSPGLFHFSELCDGPDAVRHAAREQIRHGATQIKVMASGGAMSPTDELEHSQFTVEELAAAVYEAESVGTYVLAHAYAPRAIGNALAAGVRSIEHGNLLDEATAASMKQHDAWLVPTLITYDMIDRHGPAQGVPENMLRKVRQAKSKGEEAVRIAMAAGVSIGSGSDLLGTMQPHKAKELALKAAIMGNMAAIVSATSANARLFHLEDRIGTVAVGKQADLIVVDGDPANDITVLESPENVKLVMKEGAIMKRLDS
jgi:imidazolonepropionase-like amidohydrolase